MANSNAAWPQSPVNNDDDVSESEIQVNPDPPPASPADISPSNLPMVNTALKYLDEVREHFRDQPYIYQRFLDIMKDFKNQRIDTAGVVDKVLPLLSGNHHLIQRFRIFLPPEYRMVSFNDSHSDTIIETDTQTFVLPSFDRAQKEQGFYSSPTRGHTIAVDAQSDWDEVMGLFEHVRSPTPALALAEDLVIVAAAEKTAEHDTLDGGKSQVETSASQNAVAESRGSDMETEKAIRYINKIKDHFKEAPIKYELFLESLRSYERDSITLLEVYDQTATLLSSAPDLVEELKHYMPAAASGRCETTQEEEDEPLIKPVAVNVTAHTPDGIPSLPRQPPLEGLGDFRKAAKFFGARFAFNPGDDIGSITETHFTDSGYASVKRDLAPISEAKTVPGQFAVNPDTTQLIIDDVDETTTAYSVAWSLPEDELDTYKSELSEAILKNLYHQIPSTGLLNSLTSALPSLLRTFALRLGGPGSSKAERQVMYFVHKHRTDIATHFNAAAKGSSDDESMMGSSIKQEEAVVARDIGQWLQEVEQGDVTELDTLHLQNIQTAGLDHSDKVSDLDAAEDVGDRPSMPDRRDYHDVVFKSVAYRWLLTAIIKMLALAPVDGDDVCAQIQSAVSACLGTNRSISSRRASERHTMRFIAEWNPKEFIQEQFPDGDDFGRLLDHTLTITGSATDAQVLPCAEYMAQTWPATGPALLDLLKTALVSGKETSGELQDKSVVKCYFRKSRLEVQVEGIVDSVAGIGEQIGWLGAAIRRSCTESGISTCVPQVKMYVPTTGPAICTVTYTVTELPTHTESPAVGQCWHEMFHNPVIAVGYPIPRRSRYGSGLEVPLNVMSGLTQCPRINKYFGRHFLKGFSTALVPTEKLNDAVLWHLYFSMDGSRLPYPDLGALNNVDIDLTDLTKARHIIGWCSEAKFFAGAAGMNYTIRPSQLPRPGREFSLEKVSFSVGEVVSGGCQFIRGPKDSHVRITRGSFKAKLEWVDQKYVTLWDVAEERGWLINGSAALLHLLRMSLESSKADKFKSEFLFKQENFEESPNPLTINAALDVLLNPTNQKLELYPKDEHSFTQTQILPNGQREVITKTVTSRTTVKDRVEELYETLEKLIDHHATTAASQKRINGKARIRDQLEGWDFADIATDRDPFYLKKAKIPARLLSWVDFTRVIPAITLFGKGFGDIIRASSTGSGHEATNCSAWETVPINRHLLCVSVADLRDIIDRIGDEHTNPITMAAGILWKNPTKDSPFHPNCQCIAQKRFAQKKTHQAIQEIMSDNLRLSISESVVDLSNHQNGAVIFGSKPEWKLSWTSPAPAGSSDAAPSVGTGLGHSSTSQQSNTGDQSSVSSSTFTSLHSSKQEKSDSRMVSTMESTVGVGPGNALASHELLATENISPVPNASAPNLVQTLGLKRKASSTTADEADGQEIHRNERPSRIRKVTGSIEKKFRGHRAK